MNIRKNKINVPLVYLNYILKDFYNLFQFLNKLKRKLLIQADNIYGDVSNIFQ